MKNTIQTLLGWAVVLVGILALFAWLGMPTGLPEKESAKMTGRSEIAFSVDEPLYDFGTIPIMGGNVSHTFKISNLSVLPVNIEKMYTSCMCTTATLSIGGEKFGPYGMEGHGFPIPKINKTLDPGVEATVEIVFNPRAHGDNAFGSVERQIIIENDAGPDFTFGFIGRVTP